MTSENSIHPEAAAWAASVIVDDMSQGEIAGNHRSKEQALNHFKAKLEMVGLRTLKKPQLVSLWEYLKDETFVQDGSLPTLNRGAKKQLFIDYITKCFALEGSKELKPITCSSAPLPAAAPGAVPIAASMPPYASMSHHSSIPPHASMPANAPMPHNQPYQQLRQFSYNFGSPPPYGFPGHAGAQAHGRTYDHAHANNHGGPVSINRIQLGHHPNSNSSRKRKSPGGASMEGESVPDLDALMGELQQAAFAHGANMNSFTPPVNNSNDGSASESSVEQRIVSDLMSMGFQGKDRKEIVESIRRLVEKADSSGYTPTSEEVMMDVITQREEAEEAKKMDEARKLSELETQRDTERLKEKRQEDEQIALMDATLDELRNPPDDHRRLMFPESWLLRHEETVPILTDIIDRKKSDEKKVLIEILKEEKGCKRWYDAGLPKCYFTFAIGKRLKQAQAKDDPKSMQDEMQKIVQEIKQGIALQEYQTQDNIPKIFLEARELYGPSEQGEGAGQNTADDDDDDDEIIILDDKEVDQMRSKNPGGRPSLDKANVVVEMT